MPSDLGNIYWKYANVFHKEGKLNNAKEQYVQAKKLVEGESNKEKIEKMLEAIEHDRAPYKKTYGRKKPFWLKNVPDGNFKSNSFFN